MTISFEQAQHQLAQLLDKLARGEEVVITRDGRPVARLVSEPLPTNVAATPAPRKLGSARGLIHISPDFDAPLDEFREFME